MLLTLMLTGWIIAALLYWTSIDKERISEMDQRREFYRRLYT